MNDKSDDEIQQDFALGCQRFAARFGEDELVEALRELIVVIESKQVDGPDFH